MKIRRYDDLSGTLEFELTPEELVAAYWEQERNFDLESVRCYFNDEWKENHEDATEEQIAYLEAHMDEIAAAYRDIEDNDRSADWWDSAECAINKMLS